MINLKKELEKLEKQKAVWRASEYSARRDKDFWKKRAEMPINRIINEVKDILGNSERHVSEKEDLIETINSNDSELDNKIIIACRLSDLKFLKKEANIWKEFKKIEKRIETINKQIKK